MSPTRPRSRAVQPIAARAVSELRSGCRRKRQASRATSSGTDPGQRAERAVAPRSGSMPNRVAHPGPQAGRRARWPRPASAAPARPAGGAGPDPGRRGRAARAAKPTDPASTIQAAAMVRPIQPIRITTGSCDLRGGRPCAGPLPGRPLAAGGRPALCLTRTGPVLPVLPLAGLRAGALPPEPPRLPDPLRVAVPEPDRVACRCRAVGARGPGRRRVPAPRRQPHPARRASGQIRCGHGSP